MGQLGTGGQAQLDEDVAQVEVDGPRTQKQLGGDLAVGEPLRDKPGDLQFLSGQTGDFGRVPAVRRLAGGPELLRRPLDPGRGVEVFESRKGRSQVSSGVNSSAGAAQVLAVGELGARPRERAVRRGVESSARTNSSSFAVGAANSACPCAATAPPTACRCCGKAVEVLDPLPGGLGVVGADGCLDAVEGGFRRTSPE